MIRIITALWTVTALAGMVAAQEIPESFSHLSKLDVGKYGHIFVHYNAKISKVLMYNLGEGDTRFKNVTAVIETKMDSKAKEIYIIGYDPGPSIDPRFVIIRKEDEKLTQVGVLSGTVLIVPGNGFAYVSGGINDYFNMRSKYTLDEGTIKEVEQPFYYVGLKTVNTHPLDLYTDRTFKDKVAYLPENSQIEVLLAYKNNADKYNKPYDYLIKTPFGLTGWVTFEYGHQEDGSFSSSSCGSEKIKGICFHGD